MENSCIAIAFFSMTTKQQIGLFVSYLGLSDVLVVVGLFSESNRDREREMDDNKTVNNNNTYGSLTNVTLKL